VAGSLYAATLGTHEPEREPGCGRVATVSPPPEVQENGRRGCGRGVAGARSRPVSALISAGRPPGLHQGLNRVESGTQKDVVAASSPGRHCPSTSAVNLVDDFWRDESAWRTQTAASPPAPVDGETRRSTSTLGPGSAGNGSGPAPHADASVALMVNSNTKVSPAGVFMVRETASTRSRFQLHSASRTVRCRSGGGRTRCD
jgi:hypothetical protein